jgi:hypothetical protein
MGCLSKTCFKCKADKPIAEFYKHSAMADGYLNKCKECTKKDTTNIILRLKGDPKWAEQEKTRGRDKYHRLNYSEKYGSGSNEAKKKWITRNPEKRKAHLAMRNIKTPEGNHWHHWSYKEEHFKDVILLSKADHAKIHRFIVYDPNTSFFRTRQGILLDTKEGHLEFLKGCL